MKVSFAGIGEMTATFPVSGSVVRGGVAALNNDGTVSPCADGGEFLGVVTSARQGFAGVQFAGLAQVSYSGDAPACGWTKLAADGTGCVKAGAGREYLVVAVDTAAQTAVVRL